MILALLGCTPEAVPTAEVEVDILAPEGLRDLVALAPAGATLSWTLNGQPVADLRDTVPAERLYPGDSWTLYAETPDGTGVAEHVVPEPPGGNVLVLLMDDVGVDKVGAYGWDTAAPTPVLDSLAAEGVRFDRAYASPVCSPTRGTLLTGRMPRRTGVGWIIDTGSRDGFLPYASTIVPEALWEARGAEPYADGAIGKWHLAGPEAPDWLMHPLASGFSHFVGAPGNPRYQPDTGYYLWDKNINGEVVESTTYMTTDTVDEALARIDAMPEPWFLYVAFNAPHTPLDLPPAALVETLPPEPLSTDQRYDLVLEALDTEIGRLLDGLGARRDRTTILALGDNGTSDHGVPDDVDTGRNKHTPYEGGIRVPLIVTGPHVTAPGTSDALVHVADLLPTVADLAGIPVRGDTLLLEEPVVVDGHSLLPFLRDPGAPGRELVYVEAVGNGPPPYSLDRRAVMTATHKLVRWNGADELYALEGEVAWDVAPFTPSSSGEIAIHAQLAAFLDSVETRYPYEGR